ncbi:MAG: hypothetical protein CFH41_00954 [Alphaproteobacteria bacterium MarineAlpha11_Bin1]|nr:MAG: hypothetical protein CFH41_00954 [Alphaproteobacteria bacterium MarineAlpha11_Bin1]|tara:strand:- start:11463 stop:12293 length:831 start_codon:yes stop_codon:yes gene_type:complete
MSSRNYRDYCEEQVRNYDYDRYFAAAFAPGEIRRGLMALYAFNIEIASVRERVSEAILGEIRLQWWRDAVEEIYSGSAREHAVVTELAAAIEKFSLPKESFDRMIDGRVFDMADEAPEDINAFENYVSATAGELAYLGYRICGVSGGGEQARLLGILWGGAGLLRAAPFHLSCQRVYLPKDLLRHTGFSSSLLSQNSEGIDVSPAVNILAEFLLEKWVGMQTIEKKARPAVAYVVLASGYLKRLRTSGNNIFSEGLEYSRIARQLRILGAVLTGRV